MSKKAELPPTKTIQFKKPIEAGGKTYTEFDLREPTCEEMEKFEEESSRGSNLRAIRVLIALITGVDKQVVARVEISTIMAAGTYLTDFMPGDQKGGES